MNKGDKYLTTELIGYYIIPINTVLEFKEFKLSSFKYNYLFTYNGYTYYLEETEVKKLISLKKFRNDRLNKILK